MSKIKYCIIIFVVFTAAYAAASSVFAQSATPSPTPSVTPTPTPSDNASSSNSDQIQQLQNQIAQYQQQISSDQSQENTLASAIKVVDNQIKVTQLRITSATQQIAALGSDIVITKKKISGLETDLTRSTQAMVGRIDATYKVGTEQPWQVLLSANDVTNFFDRLKYLRLMQAYDKKIVYAAEQSKNDYANEQAILQSKEAEAKALQAQLQGYTADLGKQEDSKKTLLSQTQGDEANYQHLLAQAQAQLAGFSNFTANSGGSSLLSGQTTCDDWGCYYNQRDSQWGANSLDGTQYTIASDGCLVTSMAMVFTHYGHRSVTPQTINSNSSNFASYYPAYLLYTVTADGVSATRVSASIDSTLSSGNPVIVGVHAYGGTHFVVLLSGSGGSYVMNDPYIENGHRINFTDHYSMGSIFEIDRVNM